MASQASVDAFRTLPPDKQKEALGRLSPDAKQALLAGLQTHSESSKQMFARGKPAFEGAKSQPSENLRDAAVRSLPAIGAGAFATVGAELGPLDIPFAGLGAAAGESTRQLIERGRGKPAPSTSGEAAKGIAIEGAEGAASEAVGQLAAKPLRALGAAFSKTASRSARLPLTPSEAGVGGSGVRTAEGFLEHAIPSRGVMDDFREKQLSRATEIVNEEIGRISKFSGTPEEMGNLTKKALNTSRTRMKDEVSSAYKAIDQLTESHARRVPKITEQLSSLVDESGRPMTYEKRVLEKKMVGGVQPSMRDLKKEVIPLLREIKQQEKVIPPQLLADTKTMLETIVRSPDNVTYEAMARSRSDLLAISRKLDEVLPGKRAGVAKLLARNMDDAMMKAAEDSGISGLPEQIRSANSLTREMHEKFESDLVSKIMETGKPEQIAAYVKQGGLQDIRHLNSLLSKPQQRMVQAQIARDALTDATDKVTGRIDPTKFTRAVHDLGEDRGKEIFGGNYDNIRQTANLLAKLRPSSGAGMAAGMHNWTYLAAGPSALAALVFGRPEAAAATAGTLAAESAMLRGLAKAITNPAKSARVLHYLGGMARGAPYAVYGLAKLVGHDEEPSTLPQIKDPVKQLTPLQ